MNFESLEKLAQNMEAAEQAATKWATDIKDTINSRKPNEVALNYFKFRALYERIDKARKGLYAVKDMFDKYAVPTVLKNNDEDMIRLPDIGQSFSVTQKTSASFIDKEKGFEWLREIGQEELIQETVNAGTLATFCRNMVLNEGIDPPEEIVKMTNYDTTSVRKYTPPKKA